jgi:hypothetical protein
MKRFSKPLDRKGLTSGQSLGKQRFRAWQGHIRLRPDGTTVPKASLCPPSESAFEIILLDIVKGLSMPVRWVHTHAQRSKSKATSFHDPRQNIVRSPRARKLGPRNEERANMRHDTDFDDVLADMIGRPQSRITYPYQDPRISNGSTFRL